MTVDGPNVPDRVFAAARTAADKSTYSRERGRHPGQPSHVPERLVPAEQARVGLGREEFYSMSRSLSQSTTSARMLSSCLFTSRSLGVPNRMILIF